MIKRNQNIRLRIVGRDGTPRDIGGDRRQVAHNARYRSRSRIGHDADIDEVAMLQTAAATVALIDKHDVAAPGNSTTAIIHAVYRRIVLIMTSDHRERESFKIRRTRILFHSGIHSFATAF